MIASGEAPRSGQSYDEHEGISRSLCLTPGSGADACDLHPTNSPSHTRTDPLSLDRFHRHFVHPRDGRHGTDAVQEGRLLGRKGHRDLELYRRDDLGRCAPSVFVTFVRKQAEAPWVKEGSEQDRDEAMPM
ncbi:MAG: hypothetical protein HYY13_04245 [Nitrospirae bacterium]|nr:hypothetical protein [Nitrospirota bacterium]